MEFSSMKLETVILDCNFRILPVNFDISFYDILPVFWKQLQYFSYYTSTVA